MNLSSATAGEKPVPAWESWATAVFKKATCRSFSPHCACSLGLHVSTRGSLTTVKTLCSEAPAGWPAATFYSSPGRTSALRKTKAVCRGDIGKKSHSGPVPPQRPLVVCPGLVATVSVFVTVSALPRLRPHWPSPPMKSFIFLFISGLGSHFSPGQRPPSIIPMGEKVRKGKYILI